MLSFAIFIASRYLKSTRKGFLLSGVALISAAGFVIGVAALVVALSIMNGYETEVRDSFIGVFAHGRLRAYLDRGIQNPEEAAEYLRQESAISAFTPYIADKGLIRTPDDQTGIFIRGVEIESAQQVTRLVENLAQGDLDLAESPTPSGLTIPGAIAGVSLAERMGLKIGDEITLISLSQGASISDLPQMMKFSLRSTLKTGFHDLDNNYIYISIPAAQKLFNMPGRISGFEFKTSHYNRAAAVVDSLNQHIGYPYISESWRDMNPDLFAWVQIQKWAFFIILSLIILVASFNIASTQIMISMEKTREIGILKAMGAGNLHIFLIFTFSGLLIGLFGSLIGNILGYFICYAQQTWKILALPSDVYIVDWLPVKMRGAFFFYVTASSVFLSFLASVVPAIRAAWVTPVESIRND
ncbi:ABC transporter permease [candidate division KSB1 bacterium]|nr:ABC transporter permease [candidate division KSB1 bacterium]